MDKINKDSKPRSVNIDIVKTLAVLSVIGIHFFAYIKTYGADTNLGGTIWAELIIMQALTICVPLFLITTGYLTSSKMPSVKYYKKIFAVLFIYLATSIFYQIFRIAIANDPITIDGIIRPIINLEGSQYSWYVEMYIGLFLFIPLLNIIWHHLDTKKAKGILCVTLFFICSAPHINIAGIHLPDYWTALWPIMFYYIGAYLKEFNLKISLWKRLLFLILSFGLVCLVAILATKANDSVIPASHLINEWSYPWIVVYSIAVFSLIMSLQKTQQFPRLIKNGIARISSLTLGIYLASAVFDNVIYRLLLRGDNNNPVHAMKFFIIAVPVSFICSFIAAWIINFVWESICKLLNKTRKSTAKI